MISPWLVGSFAIMASFSVLAAPGSSYGGGTFKPAGSDTGGKPVSSVPKVAAPVPTTVETAKLAVGTITVDTQIGRSAGTGFIVEFGTAPYFVTNQHVVAGARSISVVMYNGKRLKLDLKMAEASPTQDLIRIPINVTDLNNVGRLKRAGIPKAGTGVYALGNSAGYRILDVLPGEVVRVGGQDVEITCKIVPGCSGGPIVDGNGMLVGVSTYLRVIQKEITFNKGNPFGDEGNSPSTGRSGGNRPKPRGSGNSPYGRSGQTGNPSGQPGNPSIQPGNPSGQPNPSIQPGNPSNEEGSDESIEVRRYGMVISDGTEWTIRGEDFIKQSLLLYDLNTIGEHITTYIECPHSDAEVWLEDYKFNKRFELISDPELRAGTVAFFKNEEQTLRVLLHILAQHRSNGTMNSRDFNADAQLMIGYRKAAINGMVGMANVARLRHKGIAWTSDYLKEESEKAMGQLSVIRATLNSSYNELSEVERLLRTENNQKKNNNR